MNRLPSIYCQGNGSLLKFFGESQYPESQDIFFCASPLVDDKEFIPWA